MLQAKFQTVRFRWGTFALAVGSDLPLSSLLPISASLPRDPGQFPRSFSPVDLTSRLELLDPRLPASPKVGILVETLGSCAVVSIQAFVQDLQSLRWLV